MTFDEFKNKYLGKQVEFHSYGAGAFNQCVDLINAYINEVLDNNTKDYTEIIGTNAKDFNTKYDKDDFDWIKNTPDGVPQEGDIVVWNGNAGGGAGHVAIFITGDVNSFKSLDQNWSKVERVTLETHDYKNVSGWLRPKKATNPPVSEHSEEDVHKLEIKDAFQRAKKALTGVWVKDEEIDPWINEGISLDDSMIDWMEGDSRFYTLWIEPELEKQEDIYEKKIVDLMLDMEKAKKDFAEYIEQEKRKGETVPHFTTTDNEEVTYTTTTYSTKPENPSNSMDKPKPVSIDPVFSGMLVNLLKSLKKKLGF